MRSYFKMIVFVVIMGVITSMVFMGMEAWTSPLIAANAAIEFRSTVLTAASLPFTTATANEIFDANIRTVEAGDLTFYIHNATGAVSFEFSGAGVWGPIKGVITLESDFETVRSISVLQQEETPGLGGVVAEPGYLAQFAGVSMLPELALRAVGSAERLPNEVDAITGATRTSEAFVKMLNTTFVAHREAHESAGLR